MDKMTKYKKSEGNEKLEANVIAHELAVKEYTSFDQRSR